MTSRLIVTTASGSQYFFDNDRLSWQRWNPKQPLKVLEDDGKAVPTDVRFGHLSAPVERPELGKPLVFYTTDRYLAWVATSRVVGVEEVED